MLPVPADTCTGHLRVDPRISETEEARPGLAAIRAGERGLLLPPGGRRSAGPGAPRARSRSLTPRLWVPSPGDLRCLRVAGGWNPRGHPPRVSGGRGCCYRRWQHLLAGRGVWAPSGASGARPCDMPFSSQILFCFRNTSGPPSLFLYLGKSFKNVTKETDS